jgi:hypothetical protein
MHSLKKSVKPEIVNRYDLWVLRHKIGGAKVFVNNVLFIEWHLKIDGFTVRALPVYLLHPVYYN